jgi:ketosteroid isomerase-like protein
MSSCETFDKTKHVLRAALEAFGEGDPKPFAALWAQADDVTIFGGFGAYERGWEEVSNRLGWAARQMVRGGKSSYQELASGCDGELGYIIGLEHGIAPGPNSSHSSVLRVTHLFRREAGEWKIIHRHADPIIDKRPWMQAPKEC